MKRSLESLLAISVLALGCALEHAQGESAPRVGDPWPSLYQALAQLELSGAQRERIAALQKSEAARIARLERAQQIAEAALREGEVRQPFDSTHVGILVRRKAEITAYLRGTESRLVSAILPLLEPAQRSAFSRLRSGSAPGEGVASSAHRKPPRLHAQANPADGSGFSL